MIVADAIIRIIGKDYTYINVINDKHGKELPFLLLNYFKNWYLTAVSLLNLFLKYLYLIILFFSICSPSLMSANTLFNNGETLFLNNKPHEARPLLEQSLKVEQPKEIIYLYLGIIYEQLADYNKAIQVITKGLQNASDLEEELYFNLGNSYYQISDFTAAIDSYTSTIRLNPNNSSAYLNRANSNLQIQALDSALSDYILYLQLLPESTQKNNIEQIIEILQKKITFQKEMTIR